MKTEDIEHLQFIYARMKLKHGENENVDYMRRFRDIIEKEIEFNTMFKKVFPKLADAAGVPRRFLVDE